ncbi:unnamed protein product [Notodromas monacha]|uniref:PH domain-containing protein n=1 Tax=Notodromas monacha TaxID=399045 RepID=A0A7R9BSA7_9CRUS|nr:unnamed protein product [Notodromas monacha]CAG0919400.1 unnamed protein product [Notodromas monacha]
MEDRLSSEGSHHTHGDPPSFQVRARVQHHGILGKRSFSSDYGSSGLGLNPPFHGPGSTGSAKWAKRFFVVKDSFLMYYAESERKSFEKRGGTGGWFNMRPKGVVPLGGSSVTTSSEIGQEYVIHITSDEFQHGHLMLAAETRSEMERWVQAIGEASRITWNNCQLAETMLRDLESQGYALNKEKHIYYERLQQETEALRREKDKNQELEEVNERLDQEKLKLEKSFEELREQLARVQQDYEDVSMAISIVEEDRQSLLKTAEKLQASLNDLEKEKADILLTLDEAGAAKLEKRRGDSYLRELQACLDLIEEERQVLLQEQTDIRSRCQTSEARKQRLEAERTYISDQSDKLMTYSALMCKPEASPDAPKRDFETAAFSLESLESILLKTSNLSDQFKSEIAPKLFKLKDYFKMPQWRKKVPEREIDASGVAQSMNDLTFTTPQKANDEKMNQVRRCQTMRLTKTEPKNTLTALVARNSLRRDPKLPGKYHTMKLSMKNKKAGRSTNGAPHADALTDLSLAGIKEVNGVHKGESYC